MPQLSLYMDEASMLTLREQASARGLSLSSYARERLQPSAGSPVDENGWPYSFWDCYGSLAPEDLVVPEELDWDLDAPRQKFD